MVIDRRLFERSATALRRDAFGEPRQKHVSSVKWIVIRIPRTSGDIARRLANNVLSQQLEVKLLILTPTGKIEHHHRCRTEDGKDTIDQNGSQILCVDLRNKLRSDLHPN